MTVSVRYIGASRPYFETGVTGKQTSWYPGEAAAVSDADATLLLATGVFEYGETAGGKSVNDNRTIQSFSTAVVGAAGGFAGARHATIYMMGDSLAANNYVTTGTTFTNFAAEGQFNWANALIGAPFRVLGSVAAGGKTAAQVLSEQLPAILALVTRPTHVLLSCGVNDLYAATRSASDTLADITNIVSRLLEAGIVPIYSTVMARSYSSAGRLTAHLTLNDGLRQFAQYNPGGVFWDAFSVTVDPSSAQCAIRSGWTYDSAPNLHLNNVGAYYVGKKLAAVLRPLLRQSVALPAGDENYTSGGAFNLLDNPMLLGTAVAPSTGGTGNGPAGFVIQRAAGTPTWTTTMVDITDPDTGLAIGKGIQIAITAGAANDEIQIISSNFSSRLQAGEAYEAECRVSLASPVNVDRVRLRANCDSGSGESAWCLSGTQTLGNLPEGFGPLTLRSRQITALAAPTTGQFDCRIRFSAAGSATFVVSAPRLRQI